MPTVVLEENRTRRLSGVYETIPVGALLNAGVESEDAGVESEGVRPLSSGQVPTDLNEFVPRYSIIAGQQSTGESLYMRAVPLVPTNSTSDVATNPEELLDRLAMEWIHGVGPMSNPATMMDHPAYRKIVGMGEAAIPLILTRIKRTPGILAWALFDIARINPVPPRDSGKIDRVTRAWLAWGKRHNYI